MRWEDLKPGDVATLRAASERRAWLALRVEAVEGEPLRFDLVALDLHDGALDRFTMLRGAEVGWEWDVIERGEEGG